MSLRTLFASLFILSALLIATFVFFFERIRWQVLSANTPLNVQVIGIPFMTTMLSLEKTALILIFILLVFFLLYIILDRLVIQPFRTIATAMDVFAKNSTLQPLMDFHPSMTEVRTLTDVFIQYTDSIEKLHSRDMEVSRVKSDFISTAAHQLRTPLTGIRWALEALQLENLTEDQKALVKSAVDKSHDLVAVVGTLLDISSIESGKYKYQFAPTNVEELIDEVVTDFTVMAKKNRISLYYVKSEIPLPLVKADRERIKWVLNNLIENAIRYTPAEGTVRMRADQVPGKIVIRVQDTGIGISSQDRNNIFERFYRAGNAIAKENQGNGLGLYIARTIVTDHGGDLTFAANTEGPGTTFELSLPVV